ncbi:MAG: flavodoxin-dependent (E)-4-hydroxy-3-methylbut-2-enyl-diphosphate synthase [Alphaproteobacteria bacterium]|jgi:(E)-4-hydroxy-3-methylbut-2-enyl-diphosphate synthase|nr:flavodoxin-dependent (E)-4-hydroxy-3-methylbut-2-enyl-diphosphate synthase [Alphaproteobacteria bacterium]
MQYDYKIPRRKSRVVSVGNVKVGGDNPISVQSMTNTKTTDYVATIKQIHRLEEVGVDMVRVSCPDQDSTAVFDKIVKEVSVPIIADIHFHYRRGIEAAEKGASCLRINPGNIGSREKVLELVKAAKDNNCSIRIGVNSGSLEENLIEKYKSPTPEAMLESANNHIKILEDADFFNFKISVKSSNVFLAAKSYQLLAESCDYPLHLGITEAGGLRAGTVLSSIGLGNLLWQGIGDTLRVSLSADPVEEVKVGFDILKSLNLRNKGVKIISCPSCARQGYDVVKVVAEVEERLSHIKTPLSVSMLGCVVNGIGEAMYTNIGLVGISDKENVIYINGNKDHRISNEKIVDHIVNLVEEQVAILENKK